MPRLTLLSVLLHCASGARIVMHGGRAALSKTFSAPLLHRLAEAHSPARSAAASHRRDSVRVTEIVDGTVSLEEVLCNAEACVTITYTVPQSAVEEAAAEQQSAAAAAAAATAAMPLASDQNAGMRTVLPE